MEGAIEFLLMSEIDLASLASRVGNARGSWRNAADDLKEELLLTFGGDPRDHDGGFEFVVGFVKKSEFLRAGLSVPEGRPERLLVGPCPDSGQLEGFETLAKTFVGSLVNSANAAAFIYAKHRPSRLFQLAELTEIHWFHW